VPLVLYAARALPSLKRGYSLVRKWNSLPPTQQAAVQEQGRRAVVAIMAVKVAATAERSASDPPASWGEALERVLHPGVAENMAKAAVAYLQKVSEATVEQIARAVGASGKDDSTLKRAMGMARDDGYIRRVGVTFRGIKWDTTEWADLQLLDTPHVRQLEEEIVAFVKEFGVVSLDQISGELGLENEAPELRAALERAVSEESVNWFCNGIYGLSPARLDGFEPKRDLWAETKPATDERDLGKALEELEAAVKGLAVAMKDSGETGLAEEDAPDKHDDDEDPYEGLRQIQGLHDAGVLTDEEFAAKKAELLRRI
jgi:Short C-terminal domain